MRGAGIRVALPVALAGLMWAGAGGTAEAADPDGPVTQRQAIAIAKRDPNAAEALRRQPDLEIEAERDSGDRDWEIGFETSEGERIVLVVVDDNSAEVEESWTGAQVAWRMARGYEGAFGRKLNAPYVWLPLCALFVLGLLDWRRPWRVAHLDLVAIVAGFGLSHYFFNRGEIGLSVPLVYPVLLYLLARMLWLGFRGGRGLRPSIPGLWLLVGALFLVGFRVGLNVADSNVIDVGYAGVIGADQIADGEALYGNFPSDNHAGDTYGPVAYYFYVPFEQLMPWSGTWDDLPAAHAAAVFFDLATLGALFLLGRRLRPGPRGTALGSALAFGWAACPYTAYALESNTNDALVSLLLVATLLVIASPALRGAMLALATATKFAPGILFPLFATYGATSRLGASGVEAPAAVPGARAISGGAPTRGQGAGSGGTATEVPPTEPPRGPGAETSATPAQAAGTLGRYARTAWPYALAFAATMALLSVQFLLDPGLSTFWERTLGNQLGRESPFSVWGQEPSLEWLHTAVKVATVALAVLVAFRPRRRDTITVAALGAAVLIAVQLTVEHWFYLYIPWFLPPLLVALLARSSRPDAPAGAR